MCGQARILIELMEQEVVKNPPNDRRITPLHLAAENGFLSICKYIIDRIDDKNPGDEIGRTPLHFAAAEGHLEICQILVDNDVDLDQVKNPLEISKIRKKAYTAYQYLLSIFLNYLHKTAQT